MLGYNPSFFGPKHEKVVGLDTSKFPVENVSWYDSVEFCNKLSEREGLKPYYELTVTKRVGKDSMQIEEAEVKILGGSGYHIPTDAEWEHGCQAGTKTKYHCADKDEELLEYAWFDKNSDGRTHTVGEKKPNAFGLYDMHGNVREWNEEMLTNATSGAPERVFRGGDWSRAADNCAVSARHRIGPAYRYAYYGLRLARVADGSAAAPFPPLANSPGPWQPLLDAKLTHWQEDGKNKPNVIGVAAPEGEPVLLIKGDGWPHLYSKAFFQNSHLRLDFQMPNKGPTDFGVFYGWPGGKNSIEFHVQESGKAHALPYGLSLSPANLVRGNITPTGEADDKKIAFADASLYPPGQWNRLELVREGDRAAYFINGRFIGAVANLRGLIDGKVTELGESRITLGCANGQVLVRRIEIRDISALPPELLEPPLAVAPFDANKAQEYQQLWANHLGRPVEETNKIGMKLRLIPPGDGVAKAFYLGKFEVTQGEWEKVMGYNPSQFGPKHAKVAGLDTSKFPVETVSWFDSVEFCNKLSEREGFKPYYELTVKKRAGKDGKQIDDADVKILGGSGYHMPTDPEWGHGCRAGTKTKYHCGDKDEDLLEYAWTKENSDGRTHTVGEKKPNAFGLYDMHGNVREWNEEMFTNAKTGAPEGANRGGSWNNPVAGCAVSAGYLYGSAYRYISHGLRLARVADGSASAAIPPLDPAWLKAVAAMKAAQQIEAVKAELMKRNPLFNGKFESQIVSKAGVVTELEFFTDNVTDISPVRALTGLHKLGVSGSGWGAEYWQRKGKLADLSPLKGMSLGLLDCHSTQVSDLSPLTGMKLIQLICVWTSVSDLSPLKDMPLVHLTCNDTAVSDLTPLKGMKLKVLTVSGKVADLSPLKDMSLEYLACGGGSKVNDLSPLKGMPLTGLQLGDAEVSDLSPLKGMPLKEFGCKGKKVSDLSPLKGMPLTSIHFDFKPFRDTELLRSFTTLEKINNKDAKEFWKEVDVERTAFDAWVKQVAAMKPEQQVIEVVKKLQDLNPGFDGEETHNIKDGVVTELNFVTDNVTDISPVRALTALQTLRVKSSATGPQRTERNGKLADLSPLKGMKLTVLALRGTQVSDLSPLQGMELTTLECSFTKVADLTPLKDMKLAELQIQGTEIADLSPLRGMPLTRLECSNGKVSDLSPLKDMKLTSLSCTYTQVSDLTPLKDMKLTHLHIGNTKVSDLSPLKGMPLTSLSCNTSRVSDVSFLQGMPLKSLYFDFKPARDAEILRSIKTLEKINNKPAAEFLKEAEAK